MSKKEIDYENFVLRGQEYCGEYMEESSENFPHMNSEPFLNEKSINSWLRSWTQNEDGPIHGYIQADMHYRHFLTKLLETKNDIELRESIEALIDERDEFAELSSISPEKGGIKFSPNE